MVPALRGDKIEQFPKAPASVVGVYHAPGKKKKDKKGGDTDTNATPTTNRNKGRGGGPTH